RRARRACRLKKSRPSNTGQTRQRVSGTRTPGGDVRGFLFVGPAGALLKPSSPDSRGRTCRGHLLPGSAAFAIALLLQQNLADVASWCRTDLGAIAQSQEQLRVAFQPQRVAEPGAERRHLDRCIQIRS